MLLAPLLEMVRGLFDTPSAMRNNPSSLGVEGKTRNLLCHLEHPVDGQKSLSVVDNRGNVVGASADHASVLVQSTLHHVKEGVKNGDEQGAAGWAAL